MRVTLGLLSGLPERAAQVMQPTLSRFQPRHENKMFDKMVAMMFLLPLTIPMRTIQKWKTCGCSS